MTPLKIGACLAPHEIADHRPWLFDDARDIELQGFSTHKDLKQPTFNLRHIRQP